MVKLQPLLLALGAAAGAHLAGPERGGWVERTILKLACSVLSKSAQLAADCMLWPLQPFYNLQAPQQWTSLPAPGEISPPAEQAALVSICRDCSMAS